jgi:aspartyl/asparaginyl beta-hydroxylase (cupin superfamily)
MRIQAAMEKVIGFTREGERTFFDVARFSWVGKLESSWMTVRKELDDLLIAREQIPNFQDIARDQMFLTEGDDWKTFFLYAYGHRAERNCERCPQTAQLLECIPGLTTAMFSILAPGKHIPEHRGIYKGVLRYQLGLAVPHPQLCGIRVGSETRHWREGRSLIFDDTHPHEAWNGSNSHRTVLFVDFLRPLPLPLSLINRMIIRRISKTEFLTRMIEEIRRSPATF